MSIGERLKQARKSKGISQEELAQKIGASRGVITNIERDKVEAPQPLVINAICQTLKINKTWLTSGKGEMEPTKEDNQSSKILSEIYDHAQQLSQEEQEYILDVIKSYKRHRM